MAVMPWTPGVLPLGGQGSNEPVYSRGLFGAVVVTLLVAATVGPVFGATGSVGLPPESTHQAGSTVGLASVFGTVPETAAVGPIRANNTTSTPVPRHENPENRSGDSNLSAYRRWLAGRMGEVLVDCTEGARARQFGACDLDDQYPEWLDKYVDVARETDEKRDDEAGEAFAEAKENQRKFNDQVARFWRTRENYRRARDRGNTERARRLARRLGRISSNVDEISGNMTRNYGRITNASTVEMSDGTTTVENITRNVTTVARDVRSDAFVATTLTVRANATETSFLSPLAVSGRLTTENGSAVDDRHIRIAIGGRYVLTRTDGNGEFELSYRPTTLPLATDRVTVRYVPQNTSAYLPARSSLPVSVEQVDPTVTVSPQPGTVAFGEPIVVNGSVSAGNIPATGVPVRVELTSGSGGGSGSGGDSESGGGSGVERTKTVRTDRTGGYRAEFTVPATVSEGDRQVRSTVALDDRALARANATAPITVVQTITSLGLNGSADGPGTIRIAGRLATVDAEPIEGQSVRLLVGGTTVESVRTGPNGRYATSLTVPEGVQARTASNPQVRIAAQFEATGTNLEPARNDTLVRLPSEPAAGSAIDRLTSWADSVADELADWSTEELVLAAGGIVALLGLLGLAWFAWPGRLLRTGSTVAALITGRIRTFSNGSDTSSAQSGTTESPEADGPGSGSQVDPAVPTAGSIAQLQRAHRYLERGDTDSAVQIAYVATRRQIAMGGESKPPTHWEFLDRARDRLPAEDVELLHFLTKAYELAAFGPRPVGADVASAALDVAERFEEQFGHVEGPSADGTGQSDGVDPESDPVDGASGEVDSTAADDGGATSGVDDASDGIDPRTGKSTYD